MLKRSMVNIVLRMLLRCNIMRCFLHVLNPNGLVLARKKSLAFESESERQRGQKEQINNGRVT